LELIPEEESSTDAVSQRDLYYNKDPRRVPKGTVPLVIQDYNSNLKNAPQTIPQTTVGITYPMTTSSSNLLQSLKDKIGLSSSSDETTTNPQTTTSSQTTTPMITASLPTNLDTPSTTSANTVGGEEHPSILDENNAIVSKCRHDAMRNSEKIAKTTTIPQTTEPTPTTTTASQAIVEQIYKYRTAFYALLVIVLLAILGFVGYKWFTSSTSA